MLTVYIVTAIAGGVLILLSVLAGDHDTGVDADADADAGFDAHHDADGHGHEGSEHDGVWLPFFSLRFWTYALTFFGITGILMRTFTGVSEAGATGVAAGTGFLIGLAVAVTMRAMTASDATSSTEEKDLIGAEARVLVGVRKEQSGKIRCYVKGETIDMVARTDEEFPIEPGTAVMIVGVEGGCAQVVPTAKMFGLDENQLIH